MTREQEEDVELEQDEGDEGGEMEGGDTMGEEAGCEGKALRSGPFTDRSESRVYGSITHKCEVRSPDHLCGDCVCFTCEFLSMHFGL